MGIVIAATAAASAAAPSLPPLTAAQLLADVARAAQQPPGPYTATVQQTANLGLPQLSAAAQPGAAWSLAGGTAAIDIWYADSQHLRVAVPVQAGEYDARLDGRALWLWDSLTQTATKVTRPADVSGGRMERGNGAGSAGGPSASPPLTPATPQAAVSQLLRAIGPSTLVAVQSPVYVANRPAYQLSLAPKSSQSLIGRVLIAIDAARSIPLRVEVYGRGSAGLVYSLGFTALSFGTPAASNFAFSPPPGATVQQATVPSSPGALLGGLGIGPAGWTGPAPLTPSPAGAGTPAVIGTDWLAVVATPPSPAVAAAVRQLLTEQRVSTHEGMFGSSASAAPGASAAGQPAVPVGPYLAPLQAMLAAAKPVSGSWGSGRLLQTALVSVLVTNKGQILAGAVSPSVLYADVGRDAG
ncbi:MAG TPA: hypothetical protein VEH05_19290 [Streptosporangiaceae bacterium]|nr:hypothetical protein [Streptosporangiaceae bacterium]